MTKTRKIVSIVAASVAALVLLVVIAAVVIVQTDWFRQYVREKIITSTEDATGGKVDVGSFNFDLSHMRATITDFVIHGKEPAGAAPFVRAAVVQLDLRLFTSIKHILDLTYLGIEKPQANIIVFPDGTTNAPSPKSKQPASNTSPLQTVVNLAVGRFSLTNGLIVANAQKQEFNVRGENLLAELNFNSLTQTYAGRLSLEPLYVVAGRNTPVRFRVLVPVTLDRNTLVLKDAAITTPTSALAINATIKDLRQTEVSAHLNGHVSLADIRNIAEAPLVPNGRGTPQQVDIDANANTTGDSIQVTGLRVGLGQSTLEASGPLKNAQGQGALQFRAAVSLGELGRLAQVAARPEGTVQLNGTVKLDAANNYDVAGNVQARDVSFTQGTERIRNIGLQSALHLTPHQLDLQGLRLNALGGDFSGNVSLADFHQYKVDGNLRNFDIQTAGRAFGQKQLAYSGVVSGPLQASGDTRASGTKGLAAEARLSISPGRRGIPVSGKLNANYNGAADSLTVDNSFVALPHTRLNLNGSLERRLNVSLTSRDLNDLFAAASRTGKSPVQLNGGQAAFQGDISGALTSPRVTGQLQMNQFSVEGRAFQSLSANVAASASGAEITAGNLSSGQTSAQFTAHAGLRNWSPLPREPLVADIVVRSADLADVVVLAGQSPAGYSGAMTANLHVQGTIGNPQGRADVQATNGTLYGEPFDRAELRVNLADRLVTIPTAYVASGAGRVDLTGEFQHPQDSFTTGQLHAHLKVNQLKLTSVRYLQKEQPNTAGSVQLDSDIRGELTGDKNGSPLKLTQVTANGSARGLAAGGQNYGDATLSASTQGQTVSYNVTSNFAGSGLEVKGQTQLVRDYPTTADANIRGLAIERVLAVAKRTDIPARGNLSGTVHFSGTVANPQGNVDLNLARAVIYDEPLDRVIARIDYRPDAVRISELSVVEGAARIDLTAQFTHPVNDFQSGNLQFTVNSARVDLSSIRNAQKLRPGLGGTFQIEASGAGALRAGEPRLLLSNLSADVAAAGLTVQGNSLGNLTLKANTTAANRVTFALDSNLAGSAIHGEGRAELAAGYPVDATLTFNNVAYNKIRTALGQNGVDAPAFDVLTDGVASISGPVTDTARLRGSLRLNTLRVDAITARAIARRVSLQNQGPIEIAMDNGTVRVVSAHVTGPQTDVQLTGTASLPQQTVNMNLNATANLGLLQSLSQDIVSSGSITALASVQGPFSKPQLSGQIDLKNASLNDINLPNGISNANGTIVLSGTNATIRNLTGETGGGKLTATGNVSYSNVLRFGLRTKATGVRYRVQQGVSVVASADISLSGTSDSSVLSGSVSVEQLTYAPQSDIGSILSRTAAPIESASAPSPLLANMRLDIRVQTSPSLGVQASLAQNLQANADLRVRGTAADPAILGRVTISQGELVFFGSTYTVNSGTVAFYNPLRIEPIINLNLGTQAKGVDVSLNVTGPIDNMKLSYTSDPPLQFQEIVSLLASGKTPVSDPTLLANEPAQPSQSFAQMGESALVSKALADPISNRLQRVFGVTQLKIDPAFTSGSQLPTARLTFQQQITPNVTFTYTSALDDPNSTIIRAEWSFNPQYSAVATRDQNGLVSVVLFYKKQFR